MVAALILRVLLCMGNDCQIGLDGLKVGRYKVERAAALPFARRLGYIISLTQLHRPDKFRLLRNRSPVRYAAGYKQAHNHRRDQDRKARNQERLFDDDLKRFGLR